MLGGPIGYYCLRLSSISIRSASFQRENTTRTCPPGERNHYRQCVRSSLRCASSRHFFRSVLFAELRRLQVFDIDRVVVVLMWRSFFPSPVESVAVSSYLATRSNSHAKTASLFFLSLIGLLCVHMFWRCAVMVDLYFWNCLVQYVCWNHSKNVIWLAYPITGPPSHRRTFLLGKIWIPHTSQKGNIRPETGLP